MVVVFHINYHTAFGQKLYVLGSVPELGADQLFMAKEMRWEGDGEWLLNVELTTTVKEFTYQYVLVNETGERLFEPWNRKRHVQADTCNYPICHFYDYWLLKPKSSDLIFYTSAFTKTVFAHKDSVSMNYFRRTLILRVPCPRIEKGQRLAIAGNQACLGFWRPEQAKYLYTSDFPVWEVVLDMDELTFPLEYKFFISSDADGCVVRWETGGNRTLTVESAEEQTLSVVHDYPYRDHLPEWKGVGTVIPVFSLRSLNSFGVGDFSDMKLLIDWAVQTNQQLLQILPMNDTTRTHTWADSYPYSAISIYALHPMYISLSELGELHDPKQVAFFEKKRLLLNEKETVDYEGVMQYKMNYLRAFFKQEGALLLESETFDIFFQSNRSWLIPYAAFCYYRDKYQTADFSTWGCDGDYDQSQVEALCAEGSEAYTEILFIYFLQFVSNTQFKSVSAYARKCGIILKGDLPIGIHRTSVEAWTERAYFNLDEQAGAPPDDFSDVGQNWSFPTYNWDVMAKDGYVWWKNRFRQLDSYYDSFRIDHILGFFRIWEVPVDYVQGLCGHFRPALPLSVAEMETFGFHFDEQMLVPRIHLLFLKELFGDLVEQVTGDYLIAIDADHLTLKPFCNTQRKIESLFYDRTDEASFGIKRGLFAIANEVLFLPDPYVASRFHPRISASGSFGYRELSEQNKLAFDKLSEHFFYKRHNDLWKAEALKRLTPLIASTEMLICGEDLGMIPQPVHEVMQQLNILSLELERAPKSSGILFSDLQTLPYLSVCTTSTHDMPPLRNWWMENWARTQNYYQLVLHQDGKVPEICTEELATQIIFNHLCASSMLTVIPLQDWLAIDRLKRADAEQERINIPADPHHYWCYRMHITLEELLSAHELTQKIKTLLASSNR